ncbi:hypothetical protein [Streptomyces sp. TLI_146]|uniref:hypothetical protein n=1 Tax=Streptomyces sp. TLI_146 TaxID=1938858 RepID=UPI000C70D437|nr:hypothetical protein [Streptomyces sp. TLI_146]PKV86388.1 hypothetical protein BX283_3952 [Streptomyces sp. TLI_146]
MPKKNHTPDPTPTPRGWRIDPIPSRPARRDTDGNVRVALWLARDGRHVADADMVLLPSEAALLHDRLGEALRGAAREAVREAGRGGVTVVGPPWATAPGPPATAPPPRLPR